jgi:hypothetical protein
MNLYRIINNTMARIHHQVEKREERFIKNEVLMVKIIVIVHIANALRKYLAVK